ncbi:efflux RND transporter periplasmic adaptor subunit [Thalassoroseus pseudoceratinae]|uniref:efflux RND transporter periplasmic adaptor subunit n=1 Tax=Thalassoroseus pseudoceratinae TaxID=2713176 RepID=UPI00141FD47F|nr:HlyD family efflux transporter periplasmic adaptor subunit [Thalassoroseus pseudoceratinae]
MVIRFWVTATVLGCIVSSFATGNAYAQSLGLEGFRAKDNAVPTSVTEDGKAVVLRNCSLSFVDNVDLAFQQGGVLDFIVAEGQQVDENETVAHIQDAVLLASFAVVSRQAENDIEVRYARKASEVQQMEYQRDLRANQSVPGTVSALRVDEQRLAVEKSLLQLEQAENSQAIERLRLKETQERLLQHRLRAPFAGTVRTIHKRRGEAVQEGEPVLELVNSDRVRVEGEIHVSEVSRIRVGMPVTVHLTYDGITESDRAIPFSGQVTSIDLKVEPVTLLVKVRAEVKNKNNLLKDGLTADMRIPLATPASER